MSDNELITRLKFLSKIKKNEKIDTVNMIVQPADSRLTSISRTYYQEARNTTLSFIEEIIKKSFELINKYINSSKISEQEIVKHLIKDFENSKEGIINLKYTYESDNMFICNLDTILQNIDAKLSEFKSQYPNVFNIHFNMDSGNNASQENVVDYDQYL